MELDGCKKCFYFLITTAGLTIPVFVTDRHKGICKYIRDSHPAIKHFFDQWHVIKGIVKKMLKASKERDVKQLKSGQKE
jgi:hypothetical protein